MRKEIESKLEAKENFTVIAEPKRNVGDSYRLEVEVGEKITLTYKWHHAFSVLMILGIFKGLYTELKKTGLDIMVDEFRGSKTYMDFIAIAGGEVKREQKFLYPDWMMLGIDLLPEDHRLSDVMHFELTPRGEGFEWTVDEILGIVDMLEKIVAAPRRRKPKYIVELK